MTPDQEQWNAKVQARNSERLMRKTVERGGNLEFVQPEPKPGSRTPFKRARELLMRALELRQKYQQEPFTLSVELANLPAYFSRGHGRQPRRMQPSCFSRTLENRSRYQPHQGKREMARRAA